MDPLEPNQPPRRFIARTITEEGWQQRRSMTLNSTIYIGDRGSTMQNFSLIPEGSLPTNSVSTASAAPSAGPSTAMLTHSTTNFPPSVGHSTPVFNSQLSSGHYSPSNGAAGFSSSFPNYASTSPAFQPASSEIEDFMDIQSVYGAQGPSQGPSNLYDPTLSTPIQSDGAQGPSHLYDPADQTQFTSIQPDGTWYTTASLAEAVEIATSPLPYDPEYEIMGDGHEGYHHLQPSSATVPETEDFYQNILATFTRQLGSDEEEVQRDPATFVDSLPLNATDPDPQVGLVFLRLLPRFILT
jgi:hypothetical protein